MALGEQIWYECDVKMRVESGGDIESAAVSTPGGDGDDNPDTGSAGKHSWKSAYFRVLRGFLYVYGTHEDAGYPPPAAGGDEEEEEEVTFGSADEVPTGKPAAQVPLELVEFCEKQYDLQKQRHKKAVKKQKREVVVKVRAAPPEADLGAVSQRARWLHDGCVARSRAAAASSAGGRGRAVGGGEGAGAGGPELELWHAELVFRVPSKLDDQGATDELVTAVQLGSQREQREAAALADALHRLKRQRRVARIQTRTVSLEEHYQLRIQALEAAAAPAEPELRIRGSSQTSGGAARDKMRKKRALRAAGATTATAVPSVNQQPPAHARGNSADVPLPTAAPPSVPPAASARVEKPKPGAPGPHVSATAGATVPASAAPAVAPAPAPEPVPVPEQARARAISIDSDDSIADGVECEKGGSFMNGSGGGGSTAGGNASGGGAGAGGRAAMRRQLPAWLQRMLQEAERAGSDPETGQPIPAAARGTALRQGMVACGQEQGINLV